MAINLELDNVVAIDRDLQPPLYAKRDMALARAAGRDPLGHGRARLHRCHEQLRRQHPGACAPEPSRPRISDQVGTLLSAHQSFANDARAELPEGAAGPPPVRTQARLPQQLGPEAIEAGLKFARVATGRGKLVAARGGYHGRTIGALAATADKKYREPFAGLMGQRERPYNDIDALARRRRRETSAMVLEPIQGEGGIPGRPATTISRRRAKSLPSGSIAHADEIQTGMPPGPWFAISTIGVVPDILCTRQGTRQRCADRRDLMTEAVAAALPAAYTARPSAAARWPAPPWPPCKPSPTKTCWPPASRRAATRRPVGARPPADPRRPWPRPDDRRRVQNTRHADSEGLARARRPGPAGRQPDHSLPAAAGDYQGAGG